MIWPLDVQLLPLRGKTSFLPTPLVVELDGGEIRLSGQLIATGTRPSIGDLEDKLAESLWWILVLARRLDVDIVELDTFYLAERVPGVKVVGHLYLGRAVAS